MTLRFEQPEWLLLILLAIPIALIAWRWMVAMSPARRWTVVAARILLIALIAGMLSGATAVRRTDRIAVIALIDISGSVQRFADVGRTPDGRRLRVTDAVRNFLRTASRNRGPDDLLGVVVFDGSAAVVASPTRVDILDRPLDLSMTEGTDLAGAIRLAAAMFPPDAARKLVIFSDGNETQGKALQAALEIAGPGVHVESGDPDSLVAAVGGRGAVGGWGGGVTIDVVPIPYNLSREVVLESVDVPPQAPSEATITVRVVLDATDAATGTLLLTREGEPVDINGEQEGFGRRLSLAPGRNVETIQVPLDAGRVHRFEAIFEPDPVRYLDGAEGFAGDTITLNNRAQAVTLTPGSGTVLVVDGVSGGNPSGLGATLPRTLSAAGMQVETIAPEGLPTDLLSLQSYDLIILQSVAADAVPTTAHELLASYVSQLGGGLIMVGGPGSFGAGGWKGTPLEPILPVRLDLPERLVMPAAAIMLVLDNSGSMSLPVSGSMRMQQEIANEGAAMAVRTLDKTDLVGVIVFNSWHETIVPLGPNENPDATAAIIRGIYPDGGTILPPALEDAHQQLRAVDASVKHVVVLSDGISVDKERLPEIARKMVEDGITVSAIAVGDGADIEALSTLAKEGGGAFYRVTDPHLLPRIFLRAVRVVRTPMIREAPFTPTLLSTGSPVVEGVGQPPPLRGLVLTQPREDPTVTYVMEAGPQEPLLAYWNAGLGRVAAFTSDAHAQWAEPWIPWPGYARLWTQLARQIARPPADRRAELATEIVGDELRIRLDAMGDDGRPLDLLTVPGSVYTPQGEKVDVQLVQTGPGVYEGAVPAGASGNYVILLTPRQGDQLLPPVIGGVSRATGAEYRRLRSNITLLRRLAEATGGQHHDLSRPDAADLFDRSRIRPTEARVPLWRTLLAWAIVVMLLDVGTRRIAWDRLVSARFGPGLRRRAADAVRDRSEQAVRTLSRLRGAGGEPAANGQTSSSPAAAPQHLSRDDAQRIIREQAERRRAERMAARRSAPQQRPPQQTPPTPAGQGEKPSADEPPTSGLFAAKRRAQQRFNQDDQGS